jgi:HlyD family secretion protein
VRKRRLIEEVVCVSRRGKIIAAVVVVLVIAGIAGFFVFRSAGSGPTVDTATVQKEMLSVSVQASGKVQAGVKVDLFPSSAGTLDEVFVEDGQQVGAGERIAVMDKVPLELQVAQAETGVKQAQAQLDSIDAQAVSAADISAANANVAAAKQAYDAARVALASIDSKAPSSEQVAAAHAATVAAKTAYDAANTAYLAAKAAVEASSSPTPAAEAALQQAEVARDQAYAGYLGAQATEDTLNSTDLTSASEQAQAGVDQSYAAYLGAQAQLDKLQRAGTDAATAAAQSALAQAQDALAAAQDSLDKATFVAPIDGVVFFNPVGTPGADGSIPKASAGSPVSPASAPFSVVDLNGARFSAEVDEADIDRVKVGMSAEVALDAFSGETFKSRVVEMRSAAQLTATGGTIFPVELALADVGKNVLIGMKGDANISVSSIGDALVIPIEALFDSNGQSYVYMLEGNTLKKVVIQTGAITDTSVQVMSGLSDGDVVVLSGTTQYSDGMTVKTK